MKIAGVSWLRASKATPRPSRLFPRVACLCARPSVCDLPEQRRGTFSSLDVKRKSFSQFSVTEYSCVLRGVFLRVRDVRRYDPLGNVRRGKCEMRRYHETRADTVDRPPRFPLAARARFGWPARRSTATGHIDARGDARRPAHSTRAPRHVSFDSRGDARSSRWDASDAGTRVAAARAAVLARARAAPARAGARRRCARRRPR